MADGPTAPNTDERRAQALDAAADWFIDCKTLTLEKLPAGFIAALRAGASALRAPPAAPTPPESRLVTDCLRIADEMERADLLHRPLASAALLAYWLECLRTPASTPPAPPQEPAATDVPVPEQHRKAAERFNRFMVPVPLNECEKAPEPDYFAEPQEPAAADPKRRREPANPITQHLDKLARILGFKDRVEMLWAYQNEPIAEKQASPADPRKEHK